MTTPLIPPKGEEIALLKFLDAVDSEGDSVSKDLHKQWEENIRQVRGDQWRIRRSPYFLANIIKNQVRRKVSTLTESKPQIKILSQKTGLNKSSLILQNTAKAIFDRNHTEETIYKVSQFGMTMGCAGVGIPYNKLSDDIDLTFIDPRRIRIDPLVSSAADVDKAQYVRIDTVLPLHEVRTSFPGRGALVKPDEKMSATPTRNRATLLNSVLSVLPQVYRPGRIVRPGPIPKTEVKEYWLRDPQLNHEGEFLFPNGRHIVRAGDIVLLDEDNPYIDGGWPIEMFEWDIDYESPWGLDEIQDLRRLQEAINRIGDAWVDNTLRSSNFKIVADQDALDPDQWAKLDNLAGLIIRKKPSRSLEYQAPMEPSQTTITQLEGLIRLCDLLTGNSDAQGKSSAQGSAAIEGLQMARQTLVRSVARRLEAMLERVGQKLISRIFQYYTSDRVLFQQGPTREWVSFTYERQKLLEDDNGDPRDPEEIKRMYRDYKFLISPLSSLAMTRIQRTMAALQLRAATGVAPSVERILQESDMGDAREMMREGLEELKRLPAPPPPKGRSGRQ